MGISIKYHNYRYLLVYLDQATSDGMHVCVHQDVDKLKFQPTIEKSHNLLDTLHFPCKPSTLHSPLQTKHPTLSPANQAPYTMSASASASASSSTQDDLNTRLALACRDRDMEAIKLALEDGADVMSTDTTVPGTTSPYGWAAAAYYAATQGRIDVLQLAIKAKGFDPNRRESHGVTPLYGAVMMGSLACVDMLLKAGADPLQEVEKIRGKTVLDVIVYCCPSDSDKIADRLVADPCVKRVLTSRKSDGKKIAPVLERALEKALQYERLQVSLTTCEEEEKSEIERLVKLLEEKDAEIAKYKDLVKRMRSLFTELSVH